MTDVGQHPSLQSIRSARESQRAYTLHYILLARNNATKIKGSAELYVEMAFEIFEYIFSLQHRPYNNIIEDN